MNRSKDPFQRHNIKRDFDMRYLKEFGRGFEEVLVLASQEAARIRKVANEQVSPRLIVPIFSDVGVMAIYILQHTSNPPDISWDENGSQVFIRK